MCHDLQALQTNTHIDKHKGPIKLQISAITIQAVKPIALVICMFCLFAFRCLLDKNPPEMVLNVGYRQRGCDGNVLMQQIYRIGG